MYEIKDDFNMFVRSEGAYTYWEEPLGTTANDRFYKTWAQ